MFFEKTCTSSMSSGKRVAPDGMFDVVVFKKTPCIRVSSFLKKKDEYRAKKSVSHRHQSFLRVSQVPMRRCSF